MPRREKFICTLALCVALALGACSGDRRTKYIDRPTAAEISLNEAEEARAALAAAQAATESARGALERAAARAAARTALPRC